MTKHRKHRTNDEVVEEINQINPDIEILSDFKGMNNSMYFRCKICGHEWDNLPRHIICRHQGCKKCADKRLSEQKRKSIKQFVEEARAVHGDKYDYSYVNYVNAKTPVDILCKEHNQIFRQTPDVHARVGCGCPICGVDRTKVSKEEFLKRAYEKFGNKFDFSKMNYIDYTTPVSIICPIHGSFEMAPTNFINSRNGCYACAEKSRIETMSDNTGSFIFKANKVHNNLYDYSLVEYTNSKEPVKIICQKHGVFEQRPHQHLIGKGCPYCAKSKGEMFIARHLKEHCIEYVPQYCCHFFKWRLYADFYLNVNNKEYIIEYNGIQHYRPVERFGGEKTFKHQLERDQALKDYCKYNDINYIEIKYTLKPDEIIAILDNILYE